jgi:membrane protease subunit HflC
VVIDWYAVLAITQPTEYIRNVGLDEKQAQPKERGSRNAFQEETTNARS